MTKDNGWFKLFLLFLVVLTEWGMMTLPKSAIAENNSPPMPATGNRIGGKDFLLLDNCKIPNLKKDPKSSKVFGAPYRILGEEKVYAILYYYSDKFILLAVAVAEDTRIKVTEKRGKTIPQLLELWTMSGYLNETDLKKTGVNNNNGIDDCILFKLLAKTK